MAWSPARRPIGDCPRSLGVGSVRYSTKTGPDLRERTPREAHADLHVPLDRDAVAIVAETDANRVSELLPERYRRMMESPFAFLRGSAAVMATDLVGRPAAGIPVQACGDCHLMNFGAFNTPEDNILFDINDFDETLPGVDFTVDLKRLAASVVVAAKDLGMPIPYWNDSRRRWRTEVHKEDAWSKASE